MLKNAIGLFAAATLLLLVFLPSYTRFQDLHQKNVEYKEELESLKKKNLELKREKKLLEEDPVYLEKVAREKMGIVKEGEVIYRMVPGNAVK